MMANCYVRVIKEFQPVRTPCPKIGTLGKLVQPIDKEGWIRVEFEDFIDTRGEHWHPRPQAKDEPTPPGIHWYSHSGPIVIKFRADEIEYTDIMYDPSK